MLFPPHSTLTAADRERSLGQLAHVFWLTGLSGSGKSTLAVQLEQALQEQGYKTMLLDGDHVRNGLNKDLGFSDEDRSENIRRIGELNRLFLEAGIITINAFISPFHSDRNSVRELLPSGRFSEIYIAADLSTCETRDVKGLYRKARNGEISSFTGITSPYEIPVNPELVLHTGQETVEYSMSRLLDYALGKVGRKDR
ncbi:MAG: adenylylsulfate kinase [Bacteroidota bacterium]|jgi:adenylylsulfate kinase